MRLICHHKDLNDLLCICWGIKTIASCMYSPNFLFWVGPTPGSFCGREELSENLSCDFFQEEKLRLLGGKS